MYSNVNKGFDLLNIQRGDGGFTKLILWVTDMLYVMCTVVSNFIDFNTLSWDVDYKKYAMVSVIKELYTDFCSLLKFRYLPVYLQCVYTNT